MQPPRTYHCKQCGECILRMDHHCLWVGTCVGLMNAKYYWQFLLYSCLAMLIMTISSFALAGLHLLPILGLVFTIDFATLLAFQTYLIMQNKTTIDRRHLEGSLNIYRRKTRMENWTTVFTPNVFSWLLPFGTPSVQQALDYDAEVAPGGLVSTE